MSSSDMNRATTMPAPTPAPETSETDLTINTKPEAHVIAEDHTSTSAFAVMLKWMFSILLTAVVLGCLVISKVSFLNLSGKLMFMHANRTHDTKWEGNFTPISPDEPAELSTPGQIGSESTFLMLIIAVWIPYVVNFLRSMWCGALRKDRPWPNKTAFIWGVVSSILESLGISLFITGVLIETLPCLAVLIMGGVFVIPAFLQVLALLKSGQRLSIGMSLIAFIGMCLQVVGIACSGVVIMTPSNFNIMENRVWATPVALICLSIAWCPSSQKALLYADDYLFPLKKRTPNKYSDVAKQTASSVEETSETDESDYGSFSSSNTGSSIKSDKIKAKCQVPSPSQIIQEYPEYSARWKSSILTSLWKMILMPAFTMLFAYKFDIIHFRNMEAGLSHITIDHPAFTEFLLNILCSFFGYAAAWIACCTCLQCAAFAFPLCLATPVSFLVLLFKYYCEIPNGSLLSCDFSDWHIDLTAPLLVCLYVSQLMLTVSQVFRTPTIIMQKESQIFWLPGYSTIFLEQLLILNRKERDNIHNKLNPKERAQRTRVFICTTMYRETEEEMQEAVRSLGRVNEAMQQSERNFQSHVFFDNGVRDRRLTQFALQLVSVVEKNIDVSTEHCTKLITPYGMRLTWQFPSYVAGKTGMIFNIHLKDNFKVKNKKRWSQIMYMSYVLDYLMKEDDEATEEETFILSTDADSRFKPNAVEALIDLMTRDNTIGAVCSRTHPIGTGPLVWWQKFDYALGHWLLRTANHILGSVLCCPGCFSVYRAEALRQVLPEYACRVTKAADFLTKDMGEDRWMCTLLIEHGWRMEYCAAVDNYTHCPEVFEELFLQRRRWVPSSLTNQILMLQHCGKIIRNNPQISVFFFIYQALLGLAVIIGPSMMLLVMAGGLYYAWGINQTAVIIILVIVVVIYTNICLFASSETQIKAAKFMSVLLSLLMCIVVIGTIARIVTEFQDYQPDNTSTTANPFTTATTTTTTTRKTTTPIPMFSLNTAASRGDRIPAYTFYPQPDQMKVEGIMDHVATFAGSVYKRTLPFNYLGNYTMTTDSYLQHNTDGYGPDLGPLTVTTIYFACLVALFLITALLHITEFFNLFHGIWFLACLPVNYIVIIIYSICNITDRSWGTRETRIDSNEKNTWCDDMVRYMRKVLPCLSVEEKETFSQGIQTISQCETDGDESGWSNGFLASTDSNRSSFDRSGNYRFYYNEHDEEPIPVGQWLSRNFKDKYEHLFIDGGYDDTSFIAGMTDSDLNLIGVKVQSHRKALIEEIKMMPTPEIDPGVPESVDAWLQEIGLSEYRKNFRRMHILQGKQLEIVKSMSQADIKREFNITKPGHLKRLLNAAKNLRYPSESELERSRVKQIVDALPIYRLEDVNRREYDFWQLLRRERLLPDSAAFTEDVNLRGKLIELRNYILIIFAIVNLLWTLMVVTLETQAELNLFGTNALGFIFLLVFGLILIIQFLAMLVHRGLTLLHLVARTPFWCGAPYNSNWSFKDANLPENSITSDFTNSVSDVEAVRNRDQIAAELRRNFRDRIAKFRGRHLGQASSGGLSRTRSMTTSSTRSIDTVVEEQEQERQPLLGANKTS